MATERTTPPNAETTITSYSSGESFGSELGNSARKDFAHPEHHTLSAQGTYAEYGAGNQRTPKTYGSIPGEEHRETWADVMAHTRDSSGEYARRSRGGERILQQIRRHPVISFAVAISVGLMLAAGYRNLQSRSLHR